MPAFDSLLFVGFVATLLAWAGLTAHVFNVQQRRIRARAVLSAVMTELGLDEIRGLLLDARVARIRPLLEGASRELIMQAAADPDTPADIFDALAGYLLNQFGVDLLVRDAESHRTARDKWRRTAALRILAHLEHPTSTA